jgi:hypothetical protein
MKDLNASLHIGLFSKAVVAGAVTDTVCTTFILSLLMVSLTAAGISESEILVRMKSPSGLLLGLIIGLGCTVLGGYVAGRIARRSEAALGASVAVVGMVFGAFFREGDLPLWHDIVGFAAMIPCGIAGGRFAAMYNRGKSGSQGS